MINLKIYTWSCSAGACSFVLIPSLNLQIQNLQKSCIYNHDKKVIFFKIYTWSYSAGVVSYRYLHGTSLLRNKKHTEVLYI